MKDTSITNTSRVGVILMTYGSPATPDAIPAYLENVRDGRPPDDALITEFQRRYRLIGGSPLLRITGLRAAALQLELNQQHPGGPVFHAVAGMRFAPPYIADVTPEATAGAGHLVGVIMSPQYSPIIMGGYVKTLQADVAALVGLPADRWMFCSQSAGHTPEEWLRPDFAKALAQVVQQTMEQS